MTHASHPAAPRPRESSSWAVGGTVFAGVLLLVLGILSILQGIVGISENDVYARVGDYVYEFDLTSWGWTHLALGIVATLTGYGLLSGAKWARVIGIALASLAIIANFMFLPYQPVWSIVNIAIGVFIIWSLSSTAAERRMA